MNTMNTTKENVSRNIESCQICASFLLYELISPPIIMLLLINRLRYIWNIFLLQSLIENCLLFNVVLLVSCEDYYDFIDEYIAQILFLIVMPTSNGISKGP